MTHYTIAALFLISIITFGSGCQSKVEPQIQEVQGDTDNSGAIVGGLNNQGERLVKQPTQTDEMLKQQEKEIIRQKKELDDIKRQQYYDQGYRKYESQRK